MINIGKTFDLPPSSGMIKYFSLKAEPVASSMKVIKPGLLDKLEVIEREKIPDNDPILLSMIPVEEFLEFTKQTKIHWSEETERILFGFPYIDVVKGGLLRRILDRVRRYNVIHEETVRRYIPIAELHRPAIEGCNSTLSLSSKDSTDFSFSIKVLGFGGGAKTSIAFGRTIKIMTDESCLYYCVPVTFDVKVLTDSINTFSRVDIVKVENGHQVIPIPKEEDKCEMSNARIKALGFEVRELLHQEVATPFTEELTVTAGKKADWEWGLKLNLPMLGDIDNGIKGAVEALKTISFTYDLAGKYNYSAYNAPNSLIFYWDWNPKV